MRQEQMSFYGGAKEYLEKKIEHDPLAYRNHHLLGSIEMGEAGKAPSIEDERVKSALKHLKLAVLANGRDVNARNDLALALLKLKRPQRAIEEFERCLTIDPNHALSHKNAAAAYAGRGLYDKALHHARIAVRLAPRDLSAHRNLARLLDHARGDSRSAVYHNDLAIRHGPGANAAGGDLDDAEAYRRLAIMRVGRGETNTGYAHQLYDAHRALTNKKYTLPYSDTTVSLLLKAKQQNLPF